MSKPRYDWWGYVKSMIRRYPNAVNENEKEAIERAINLTRDMDHGEERLRVIDLVFWKGTHKIPGAAMKIHYSERMAAQWHGDFIRLVGENFRCDGLKN